MCPLCRKPIEKDEVVKKKLIEEAESAAPGKEAFGLEPDVFKPGKGDFDMPTAVAPAPASTEMQNMAPIGEAPLPVNGSGSSLPAIDNPNR